MLVAGTLAWAVTALVAGVTGVENLVANIVLLGSFLAPVVVVLFALARTGDGELTAEQIILGFLAGGVLGTLSAALTEVYFLPNAVGPSSPSASSRRSQRRWSSSRWARRSPDGEAGMGRSS